MPDADGAAGLLGGHADGLGEGRVGELHLGELLDVHARAHGGRDDLDDPGWLAGLITREVPLDRWEDAHTRRPDDIKTILNFPAA